MQYHAQLRFFVVMGLVLGCVTCGARGSLDESSPPGSGGAGGAGGAGGTHTASSGPVTASVGVTSTTVATTGVGPGTTTSSTGVGGAGTTTSSAGVGGAGTTTGVGGSETGTGGAGGSIATSSSSGMPECVPTCTMDVDCQDSCPAPPHGVFCCDAQTQACYHYHHHNCPNAMTSSSSTGAGYPGGL